MRGEREREEFEEVKNSLIEEVEEVTTRRGLTMSSGLDYRRETSRRPGF